ncbi:unnamed protein product [Durusdinium trenchii]|uniref:Uncharacterized protein n=1 Tax=Durusdinium trenchii TaxID=1381693 RepID=A0ABP0PSF0_9DINO
MLRDAARNEPYRAALERALRHRPNATVMDIGTGSGFLAMLAAKYGAKKVYAIEGSSEIARVASRLSRANGFAGILDVIPKHLEDITEEDVPLGSVDIIVSELFSHFLVGEVGLQVVTEAKRFLKPGGLILPSQARIKLSPFADPTLGAELRARHSFWQTTDFMGLDLSSALPFAEEQVRKELILDVVQPEQLLVPPDEAPEELLDLEGPEDPAHWDRMSFTLKFPSRSHDALIDGLCAWWDVIFADDQSDGTAPVLWTAPGKPNTVWAQCRFLLHKPLSAAKEDELKVVCELKSHKQRESYSVNMTLINETKKRSALVGPVELSNVYARHFAKAHPLGGLSEAERCVKEPSSLAGTYVGIFAAFGDHPETNTEPVELEVFVPPSEDAIGCKSYQLPANSISLVRRGNCTFVEKARHAQDAGALGVLVAFDSDQVMEMGGSNQSKEDEQVKIWAVAIGETLGEKFYQQLGSSSLEQAKLVVSVTSYHPSPFNVSELILILTATALVAAGTFFSTADMRQTSFSSAIAPQTEEVQELDAWMAGGFCVMGSCVLVFLFFFMKYAIYFIMFAFCVGGALCLTQFISMCLYHYAVWSREKFVTLPGLGPISKAESLALVPSSLLALCWVILRNTHYAWPFQDIIGAGFLCWMQRTLRLPNLKIATILLVAMFFFDIYWVFISVHQFHQSVMVSVATGGGTGEAVPMLIRIPQFGDPLGGDRMLGFGDIALPGLLVSYLRRHDLLSHRRFFEGYFGPSLLGYFVGLCATIVALTIMKMGQPALLYLVPCTLGTTVLLASCRGELSLLWDGKVSRRPNEDPHSSDGGP